jgi:hypothetical protein
VCDATGDDLGAGGWFPITLEGIGEFTDAAED